MLLAATICAAVHAPASLAAPQVVLGEQTRIQTVYETVLREDGAVDLDGDGVLDFVTATVRVPALPEERSATLGFARGLGSRQFSDIVDIAPDRGVDETFATADLDGDGDVDLVGAQVSPDRRLLVLENDGSGAFIPREGPPQEQATDFTVGDMDGDGDLDLYFSGRATIAGAPVPTVRVAALDGLTFTGTIVDSGLQGPGFDVGDVNGDGRVDVANYTRTTRALAFAQGGGFGASVPLPPPANATDVAPSL